MPETVKVADRYVMIRLHAELDYDQQKVANDLFDRIMDSEGDDIDAVSQYVSMVMVDDITPTEAKSFTADQSIRIVEASMRAPLD